MDQLQTMAADQDPSKAHRRADPAGAVFHHPMMIFNEDPAVSCQFYKALSRKQLSRQLRVRGQIAEQVPFLFHCAHLPMFFNL